MADTSGRVIPDLGLAAHLGRGMQRVAPDAVIGRLRSLPRGSSMPSFARASMARRTPSTCPAHKWPCATSASCRYSSSDFISVVRRRLPAAFDCSPRTCKESEITTSINQPEEKFHHEVKLTLNVKVENSSRYCFVHFADSNCLQRAMDQRRTRRPTGINPDGAEHRHHHYHSGIRSAD